MNPATPAFTIALFGARDRTLLEMLATLGGQVLSMSMDELDSVQRLPRRPDVLMIDVRTKNQLPEGVAQLKRRHTDTPIVLVCSAMDSTLILDAMRAGISECIADPLTPEGVGAAIGRMVAQRAPDVTGDVFAFLGAKGGVGTTTVAVNVASALARSKERTLFIDLHLAYGDAAVYLGAEPRFSVVDALDNIHRLDEALFKTLVVDTGSGVDLLASSAQSAVSAADVQRVRRLLEFARSRYRYVVIDCPRSDAVMIEALEGASRIVLLTNQELPTLRSGSRMAAALRQRYRAERVMVVVNRFDGSADIGHDDVEKVVGSAVKHVLPSDYRASLEALNRGKPLVLRNHTRVAHSLDALAADLGGLQAKEAAPKTGGLFGRLTGKK